MTTSVLFSREAPISVAIAIRIILYIVHTITYCCRCDIKNPGDREDARGAATPQWAFGLGLLSLGAADGDEPSMPKRADGIIICTIRWDRKHYHRDFLFLFFILFGD